MTNAFALTYSPALNTDDAADGPDGLAHLVDVASGIRSMTDDRPLYSDVRLVDGKVRFVVELDPLPTYGASNIARGLVTRAISEADIPGQLDDEVSCETVTH